MKINKEKITTGDLSCEFLTMTEAREMIGVCKATLHIWVNKLKILPASQPVPNGKKFIKRSDIEKLLDGKQEEAQARIKP